MRVMIWSSSKYFQHGSGKRDSRRACRYPGPKVPSLRGPKILIKRASESRGQPALPEHIAGRFLDEAERRYLLAFERGNDIDEPDTVENDTRGC